MLAEAARGQGTARAWVDLALGDICLLDFGDGVFDSAMSERVFQHLAHPTERWPSWSG
jgi:hypothetical protein